VVLGIELRASHLSYTSVLLLFSLLFRYSLTLLPRLVSTKILLCSLPQ
jgi:hypothetical protein